MARITAGELAIELGTDGRTVRKFLRSITPAESQPGKGSRWGIEKREVRSLSSKFAKYQKALEEAKAAKAAETDMTDDSPETDDEA